MARLQFPNTVAGLAQANAVPNPKHIIEDPRRGYTVLTGSDMPEVPKATDAVLSKLQFFQGALAISQDRLAAVETYVSTLLAGSPTRNQRLYWTHSNEFRRNDLYIQELRTNATFKGALTPEQSRAEMDNIFLAGSGYEPKMSAG